MKLLLTLRARIVLLMVAAVVPLCGLAVINTLLEKNAAIARAAEQLQVSAAMVAARQDLLVAAARQMLQAVAIAPGLAEGNAPGCHGYLKALHAELPMYANLGIIAPDGNFRCTSLVDAPAVSTSDRLFFRQAVASGKFVAGGFLTGRVSARPAVPFALPVNDAAGKIAFVAFASLDLEAVSRSLAVVPLPPGSRLVIADREGLVLATQPSRPAGHGLPLPNPILLSAALAMQAGTSESLDESGRRRIFSYQPAGAAANAPFLVSVSADREAVVAPVWRQFRLELLALLAVAVLGGWAAWLLGGRAIVKPAADILAATRLLEANRLDVRIAPDPNNARDEFSQIATGFNRMANALQATDTARTAALAHSQLVQTRLLDAQRLARIGYWQFDMATGHIWCSDEVYEVFGIDRTQFSSTYDGFLDCIHPDDRDDFVQARNAAVVHDQPFTIDFRAITKDGQIRWIHQFSRADIGEDGRARYSRSGCVQDITERKNIELTLARTTALLNRTGSLAKVGGWEMEIATMHPVWSAEIYRIFGVESGGHFGFQESLQSLAENTRPVLEAAVAGAIKLGTPWDLELPLITPAAEHKWVRSQGWALREGDQVVRLAGVIQDITAQHDAQAHSRLLETCISRLNDVVMITEAEPISEPGPRIVFVNEAFERLTGYSREEVLGKSPRFLQGRKTQRSELYRIGRAMKAWQPVRAELINYTKSGTEFWNEFDIVPVANKAGWYTHWVAVERDVTARKLAEQAFIDSELRYEALFALAPVPMWVYDVDTTGFLAVNQAAVAAYGYSAEEFMAMTIFDLRPRAEHGYLRQWLKNPPGRKALWQDLRKDGTRFSVETVSQTIQYAGKAARFVVALDKTAQDKAEKDMQDYLFTLQRAADAAQAITWHQTLEGTMQEIAEQARGVIGAHQAVVTLATRTEGSEGLDRALHATSLSEKYAQYREQPPPGDGLGIYALVCQNNRTVRLNQAELLAHPGWRSNDGALRPQGQHPPMRGWLAVPLTGRNGENVGLLQLSDKYEGEFTKQDEYEALELGHLATAAIKNSRLLEEVSRLNAGLEQKVAERTAALARQEALFRALAEQAPQTVWTASPDGAGFYFNRAWFDLMGGKLDDWSGYQWLRAIHPEDIADVKSSWQLAQQSCSAYAGVRRIRAQDGSYRTMAYRVAPVHGERGEVAFWVGIDADITDIKVIETALRLSNQELEAFSYSVSHDLRSPLNTIDGFSRLLAKQLTNNLNLEVSDKVQHYLARIQAGVAQMGQLIEDLLSLSQVTRAQLRTEPVNLSVIARRMLDERQARQPERQVVVHIEDGLVAEVDERLVQVVLENLLSNAWKFTLHAEPAEISFGQMLDAAGMPVFYIRDNGAGFDMAYASKLFDPFQRLHAASEFSGTGIGLATVSRVIKRHDGRIWAHAEPGLGATFFFTFPRVKRTV